MVKGDPIEKLLWSIALPGFGQLLNKAYLKGIILITLEFLININANINTAIVESFNGNIELAIHLTDYQWIMFYPCVYIFSIYDAYKDGGGAQSPFSTLPFILAAFLGTIGVIYSRHLLGPIWLPLITMPFGAIVGYFILKLKKV